MEYKSPLIISIQNKVNKVVNAILNNKFSNFIKECFYQLFGVPYPEYLYNDLTGDYVVSYTQGRSEQSYYFYSIKTPFKLTMGELRTTPDTKWALDISKYNVIKKKYLIYAINRTLREAGGQGVFRVKRILTYT